MNYAESDEDEENFDLPADAFASPLQSPARPALTIGPVPTREGSPVLLTHPTLNDNVDEVLEEVQYALHDIAQVEEDIEELTDLLEDTDTKVGDKKVDSKDESGESIDKSETSEIIHEGHIEGDPLKENNAENPASSSSSEDETEVATMVNYDAENKEDGEKAQDSARHIKVEFDGNDIRFWFSELEGEMMMAGVNKQWLKKTVLQRNLPVKVKEDVKAYLSLPQDEAGATIYLTIKKELLRIYAPKPQDNYLKALSRTMVGLPSQLGKQIINDICRKSPKLEGCCCPQAANAIWSNALPVNIRAHISNMDFTKDSYVEIFEAADKVYLSSKQVNVAAVSLNMDETLPAFDPQNQPTQVAAVANRGRGKNRGRGNQRGGSGTGTGGRGQNSRGGRGGGTRPRGPRHTSNPPEQCCDRHYVHGADAWYCLKPLTCPWKDKVTSKD